MKRVPLKWIPVTLVIVVSLFALSGCGAKSTASTNPGATTTPTATAATQSDSNLITSQQQVKAIDIKSTKGQKQVDAQISKNLRNLDKSLNALDKSLGNL